MSKKFTLEQKLGYLKVLEENGMNKSKAARELQISRSSLQKIYDALWGEYISRKETIEYESVVLKEKEIELKQNLSKNMQLVKEAWEEAMFTPEEIKSLSPTNRINLIRILTPYAAKQIEDGGLEQRETEVTSFIQKISRKITKR